MRAVGATGRDRPLRRGPPLVRLRRVRHPGRGRARAANGACGHRSLRGTRHADPRSLRCNRPQLPRQRRPPRLRAHHRSAPRGGWAGRVVYPLRPPVAGLADRDSNPGSEIAAGEEIGRIGPYPENGDWAPHLHFQLMTDLLGREGDFPGVAPPSQRDVWLSLSPDPNLVLGIPDLAPAGRNAASELLGARRRLLGPSLSISYRRPLEIVRGKGAYLYDDGGQPYLDCVNNVAQVGHAHPRVVEAGQDQMAVLNTNTRYLHDSLTEYARRLAATLPDPLGVCFFVCTGSEANELALRMARTHTGREGMVVLEGGYHGNTSSLVQLSSYKFDGPGGAGPPSWVACVPMPDGYRGRYRFSDPDCGALYAEEVGRAVDALDGTARRLPLRVDPELRRPDRASPRLPARRVRARAGGGRGVHRRRGAGRVRARRFVLLGLRGSRGGAGHRHHGQAHRQRPSARRRGHHPGDRRVLQQRHGVLQHLRRQPGVVPHRPGGAGRDRRRESAGPRPAGR